MALRLGRNDAAAFGWFDAGQPWTSRQLAALAGVSEPNMRRRLSQYAKAGLVTSSPAFDGSPGRPEHDYYVTPANARRLRDVCPGVEVRPARARKPAAAAHQRWLNEFWMSIEVALRNQDYYAYRLFPHYQYDTADEKAPTNIRTHNTRSRTPSDATINADFALTMSCRAGCSLAYGEIDLGTESLDSSVARRATLLVKLEAYAAHHDSNGYTRLASRLGESFSGFRVLVVSTSKRRLAGISKLCSGIGSSDFVWLTTLDCITPGTVLGPIWQTGEGGELRPLLKHWRNEAGSETVK